MHSMFKCLWVCNNVTRSGIFFYQIQLYGLGHSPCCKDLQHLEQKKVVLQILSSFGKKNWIFGHIGLQSMVGIVLKRYSDNH